MFHKFAGSGTSWERTLLRNAKAKQLTVLVVLVFIQQDVFMREMPCLCYNTKAVDVWIHSCLVSQQESVTIEIATDDVRTL